MTAGNPIQLPSAGDRMIVTAGLSRLTPAESFAYFTTPELLMRWWPPEASLDARRGGSYSYRWPAMEWELVGTFLTYQPGERLTFTWQWRHRPELPERTVNVVFAARELGCQVTVTHGTYGNTAAEQADRDGHIEGWLFFLSRLRDAVNNE